MSVTDSLADILGRQRYDEPPEVGIIKNFVRERFKHTPQVKIGSNQIIIGVPDAALAGALRMELHKLQQLCRTKKRLIIRLSS